MAILLHVHRRIGGKSNIRNTPEMVARYWASQYEDGGGANVSVL